MRAIPILTSLSGLALGACAGAVSPDAALLAGAIAGALVLNTALTLLVVWGWSVRRARGRSRRGLLRELERELRHLRHWAGEEGALRKAGLLRELEALGARPPDLTGYELSGADLGGLELAGVCLRGANLAGANLQGARLDGADLFGVKLADANLSLSGLRGANLRGAELTRARLVKADLRQASLQRADLVDADLQGARLDGVVLEHARFADPAGAPDERRPFQLACHPSVEDWIRARLDADGRYREQGPGPDEGGATAGKPPDPPPDAGAEAPSGEPGN